VEPAEATIGAGVLIDALAVDGTGLWAGGPNGLLFLPDGTGRVTMPALSSGEPLLGDRVAALAVVGRRVVVAIGDRILWRGAEGRWTHESPLGLGPLTALTGDGEGVWVGGEVGVRYFSFDTREFQTAAGAGDLPGRVTDLAASDDYLWVATDGGLVRIEKRVVLR
jgi:ligand-binding sensor domain-containing protein